MSDVPSVRARELLRGAYDTHVHVAPDVVQRKIDDVSLARELEQLGMDGVVLKSHYGSTAERAADNRGPSSSCRISHDVRTTAARSARAPRPWTTIQTSQSTPCGGFSRMRRTGVPS
jgi:Family of unknown function (DUF6282)